MRTMEFDQLILEAIKVRYAVYQAGGMATKSGVEDVLMHRFGVDRHFAHMVMNHLEYYSLDSTREWTGEGEVPTLADYPEIELVGRVPRISVRKEVLVND